jgi:hypothetical protein
MGEPPGTTPAPASRNATPAVAAAGGAAGAAAAPARRRSSEGGMEASSSEATWIVWGASQEPRTFMSLSMAQKSPPGTSLLPGVSGMGGAGNGVGVRTVGCSAELAKLRLPRSCFWGRRCYEACRPGLQPGIIFRSLAAPAVPRPAACCGSARPHQARRKRPALGAVRTHQPPNRADAARADTDDFQVANGTASCRSGSVHGGRWCLRAERAARGSNGGTQQTVCGHGPRRCRRTSTAVEGLD